MSCENCAKLYDMDEVCANSSYSDLCVNYKIDLEKPICLYCKHATDIIYKEFMVSCYKFIPYMKVISIRTSNHNYMFSHCSKYKPVDEKVRLERINKLLETFNFKDNCDLTLSVSRIVIDNVFFYFENEEYRIGQVFNGHKQHTE